MAEAVGVCGAWSVFGEVVLLPAYYLFLLVFLMPLCFSSVYLIRPLVILFFLFNSLSNLNCVLSLLALFVFLVSMAAKSCTLDLSDIISCYYLHL